MYPYCFLAGQNAESQNVSISYSAHHYWATLSLKMLPISQGFSIIKVMFVVKNIHNFIPSLVKIMQIPFLTIAGIFIFLITL